MSTELHILVLPKQKKWDNDKFLSRTVTYCKKKNIKLFYSIYYTIINL